MTFITKLLTSVVDIVSDPLLYTYEFAIVSTSGSCDNIPSPIIFASGGFTTTGETTVTANISYTDVSACLIAVSFILYFDNEVCQTELFYVYDNIINPPDPDYHWECISGMCTIVVGLYDPEIIGHYNTPTCNNECIINSPINCIKSVAGGFYNCNTQELNWFVQIPGETLNPNLLILIPSCSNESFTSNVTAGTISCELLNFSEDPFYITIYVTAQTVNCVSQANILIDCFANPCDNTTIDGSWVDSGAFSVNVCGRPVPPITDNYDCKGAEGQFISNIYNMSLCSKNGFFKYKYSKIIQNLDNCGTVNLYWTIVPSQAGFIYPTASVNNFVGGPTIVSSYKINRSNVTQHLDNVFNSNNLGYVVPTVDWTSTYALSGDFATDIDIKNEIGTAFTYWANLLSYVFGINFQFNYMSQYNLPPSSNSEWYSDFFVSIINDPRNDDTNIFYNNYDNEILSSFGTPLNYTNLNAAKGGVIGINANSPYIFYANNPTVNGLSLKTEIFKSIGNSLGLRNYYNDIDFSNILECDEVVSTNSLFSQSNTYMSHNILGTNINDNLNLTYNTILDGFCIECLLKKYLL